MKKTKMGLLALAALLSAGTAQAHIVGLGWNVLPNGDVEFSALHWHDEHAAAGALIVDGVSYNFTSVTHNDTTMDAQGALVNATYSSYAGGVLTSLGTTSPFTGNTVNDWLHVTVSGLTAGAHTLDAEYGPGGLTSWELDGDITTAGIVLPPASGVPDSGSTVALLGLSMLGLGLAKRKSSKR